MTSNHRGSRLVLALSVAATAFVAVTRAAAAQAPAETTETVAAANTTNAAAADPAANPPPTVSAPVATAAAPPAPAAPPPPYSLPWQLRPAAVGNVLRSDTSIALYKGGDASGSTIASTLLATYKVTPWLAPLLRLGFVRNADPTPAAGAGAAFVNPIVGLTGGWKGPANLRIAAIVGGTIPVGMGGAAAPGTDGTAAAVAKGVPARSAMDNAMFAVNYFTALAGGDVAWVAHKLTVQLEATLLQLFRVRNEMFAPESTRTNATGGLHLGYFVIPLISLGAELRYQRWLSTPAFVTATPAARDNTTFAVGPRFHFKVGDSTWLRPGISYSAFIDEPLNKSKYNIVQVDLPVAF
jgi:hypothetical protein